MVSRNLDTIKYPFDSVPAHHFQQLDSFFKVGMFGFVMRHFPSLLKQLKGCLYDPNIDTLTGYSFRTFVKQLESEHTKRLIFDARQAQVFDQSSEIEERRREKIQPPFKCFYMELTEPILLKAQEPGCQDVFWSVLFHQYLQSGTEVLDKGNRRRTVDVTKVTFFYKSADDKQFIDRTWSVSPEGYPMVGRPPKSQTARYKTIRGELSASGLVSADTLPDYVQEGELISVFDLEEKKWWEESIIYNTNLLYWIFAYTMAKSVKIVEIPDSRQVKRSLERQGKIPNPWHVVRVQPTITIGKEKGDPTGIKHSYRYDVIGHLRFNKHKTKDGYKESIEWVSDHQRGVENELYIPKTYKVESGKTVNLDNFFSSDSLKK
jgi:hypothetical protein